MIFLRKLGEVLLLVVLNIAALGALTALACAAIWFMVSVGYFTLQFLNSLVS